MIKGVVYNNRPLISLVVGWRLGVQNINVLISKGIPIIGVGLLRRYSYALNMDVKYNSLILQK